MVGRDGDSEAGTDVEGVVLDEEWRLQSPNQFLSHGRGTFTRNPGKDDRKLVAAEAGDGVRCANLMAEPGTNLHQELIADMMAERFVDLLEPVEVHDQQGQRRVLTPVSQEGLFKTVQPQHPVR